MKAFLTLILCVMITPLWAVTWTYQVNINGSQGPQKSIDKGKNTFEAGPYYCEATPIVVANNTEFRSLVCSVGSGSVSTGGLCTRRAAKVPSVQYAILNLNGPKNAVNIVVACQFE